MATDFRWQYADLAIQHETPFEYLHRSQKENTLFIVVLSLYKRYMLSEDSAYDSACFQLMCDSLTSRQYVIKHRVQALDELRLVLNVKKQDVSTIKLDEDASFNHRKFTKSDDNLKWNEKTIDIRNKIESCTFSMPVDDESRKIVENVDRDLNYMIFDS